MRRAAGLVALLVSLSAGLAHAEAPGASPRPVARPADAAPAPDAPLLLTAAVPVRPQARPAALAPEAGPAAGASLAAGALAPEPETETASLALAALRPLPKPAVARAPTAAAPREQLIQVSGAGPAKRLAAPGRSGALCGVPGLTGHPIAPITSRVQGCGLPDGVEVTAISGIPLSLPIQVDCGTAVAFKRWLDRGIVPAVGNRGGGLARIEVAGSYMCRPRNNQRGAKVSEHGRGHAVDLSGLRLRNGQTITVLAGWKSDARLLKAVHASACGPFGTVLGPKSDRFHQDHIHVDTAANRGGPYCR